MLTAAVTTAQPPASPATQPIPGVQYGTHVDTFAAFDRVVPTAEHADAPGDGAIRKVRTPREIT